MHIYTAASSAVFHFSLLQVNRTKATRRHLQDFHRSLCLLPNLADVESAGALEVKGMLLPCDAQETPKLLATMTFININKYSDTHRRRVRAFQDHQLCLRSVQSSNVLDGLTIDRETRQTFIHGASILRKKKNL